LRVISAGLGLGGAAGLHHQWHAGELIEWEEAGAGRTCLHRERRFELEEVLLGVWDPVKM
jgi:hypothetical protein